MRVTAADGATLLDEIERLLEKAASAKSRAMRLADRAARFYAPMVHVDGARRPSSAGCSRGASLHDAVIDGDRRAHHHLSLRAGAGDPGRAGGRFGRACSAPASSSTPAMPSSGWREADTVVFDKTGTLTLPEPRVVNAAAIDPELLQMAARLALSSRHPLAMALAREGASHVPLRRRDRRAGAGRARDARRHRSAARQRRVLRRRAGWRPKSRALRMSISSTAAAPRPSPFAQKLRPDAVEVVQALRRRGVALHILSGDRADAVRPVAEALGIADGWPT